MMVDQDFIPWKARPPTVGWKEFDEAGKKAVSHEA
jgi:hypothetical protein